MPERKTVKPLWILLPTLPAVAVTSFFMGGVTASNQLSADREADAKVQDVKVQRIETTVIKKEPYPEQPDSCAAANTLAVTLAEAVAKYDKTSGLLQSVARDLAAAIVLEDSKKLNSAKASIGEWHAQSVGPANTIGVNTSDLEDMIINCANDLKR